MAKFMYKPSYGYYVNLPTGIQHTEFEGGAGRYRGGFVNQNRVAVLQYDIPTSATGYVGAFIRNAGLPGNNKITLDVRLDDGGLLEEREGFIRPNTVKIYEISFGLSRLEWEVEIIPRDTDYDFDSTIVTLWEEYGGNVYELTEVINLLSELVNVQLPDALGAA